MKKMCFYPPHTWNSHLESSNVFILFSRELHMHIKLYFRCRRICIFCNIFGGPQGRRCSWNLPQFQMERERKLYFRINPIPRLEIDRAVTNGSAVYILLGEILCQPPTPPPKLHLKSSCDCNIHPQSSLVASVFQQQICITCLTLYRYCIQLQQIAHG